MTQSIALIGDSIFDNAGYVPGEPDVAEQLRGMIADDVDVTLLAVDGDFVGDVSRQIQRLPPKTTHVFVSAGGNNALSYAQELLQQFDNAAEMFYEWSKIQKEFRSEYREMLASLSALNRKAALCTIYDAVPSIDEIEATALSLFNDVIVSEAIAVGMPLVDLRRVCTEAEDYSRLSPIEPSCVGGAKIAAVLHRLLTEHDFSGKRTIVYY
jgi:hypothetical protein